MNRGLYENREIDELEREEAAAGTTTAMARTATAVIIWDLVSGEEAAATVDLEEGASANGSVGTAENSTVCSFFFYKINVILGV